MKRTGLSITLLALLILLLPPLTAQEKDDEKDPDKDEPKVEKKVAKPRAEEEKFEYGKTIKAKVVSMSGESAHDFSIEVPVPDPEKILRLAQWQQQRMFQIANQPNPQARANEMVQFKLELARRQATDIHSMKVVDVRATENVKVRSMVPPIQFDDRGNIKKWTKADLIKLRGKSKFPGFPADLDALKIGQTVELYLAKPDKPARPTPAGKKKIEDDLDLPPLERPEVVMIVILREPPLQP